MMQVSLVTRVSQLLVRVAQIGRVHCAPHLVHRDVLVISRIFSSKSSSIYINGVAGNGDVKSGNSDLDSGEVNNTESDENVETLRLAIIARTKKALEKEQADSQNILKAVNAVTDGVHIRQSGNSLYTGDFVKDQLKSRKETMLELPEEKKQIYKQSIDAVQKLAREGRMTSTTRDHAQDRVSQALKKAMDYKIERDEEKKRERIRALDEEKICIEKQKQEEDAKKNFVQRWLGL